jgi:hypothetical protein
MAAAGGVRRLPVERTAPEGTRYGQGLTQVYSAHLVGLVRAKWRTLRISAGVLVTSLRT